MEGGVVGSAGCVLSMADMVCLACMQNCGVHEQCWICVVYVKFIAADTGYLLCGRLE